MSDVVRVRRTGGLAGRPAEGALDLASDDPRVAEVRRLVAACGPVPPARGRGHPDTITYELDLAGRRLVVAETDLTPGLRRIADLLLAVPDR